MNSSTIRPKIVSGLQIIPIGKDCPAVRHPVMRCPATILDIGNTPTPVSKEAMRSTKHAGFLITFAAIGLAITGGYYVLRGKLKASETKTRDAGALVQPRPTDAGATPLSICKDILGERATKAKIADCEARLTEFMQDGIGRALKELQ